MIWALILTTYMTGSINDAPAVAQTSTPGFANEQACREAGKVAQDGAPHNLGRYNNFALVTYQCVALNQRSETR